MNIGLIVSVVVHTALLLTALLTITRVPPFEIPPPPAIAISMVSPSELATIAKGERNAKNLTSEGSEGTSKKVPPKPPLKTPPPPPQEAAASPPPPPPPAEPPKAEPPKPDPIKEQLASLKEPPPPPEPEPKKAEPPPGPSPEEKKKLEDALLADQAKAAEEAARKKAAEAEARAKAEAERKKKADQLAAQKKREAEEAKKRAAAAEAAAKAKAEADAKKQFNPDDIMKKIETAAEDGPKQALIDKAKPKPANAAGSPSDSKQKGPRAGDASGTAKLTQGEQNQLVALIRDQLARCWNINSGHPDAARMQPVLQFELNRDGSLRGEPVVANPDSSPAFQDAVGAARRALRCASPFKDLPPEKYEFWEYASFRFDPSQMFR